MSTPGGLGAGVTAEVQPSLPALAAVCFAIGAGTLMFATLLWARGRSEGERRRPAVTALLLTAAFTLYGFSFLSGGDLAPREYARLGGSLALLLGIFLVTLYPRLRR